MRFFIILLCIVSYFPSSSYAQVDTAAIKEKVMMLSTAGQHTDFWKKLRARDQAYRGGLTDKLKDLENLVSVCYYIIEHGYPDRKFKPADILPTIWIHSPYPDVDKQAFPLILIGYKMGRISEKNLRYYYLRNLYWNRFYDRENGTKDLKQMFNELKLNINDKPCVDCILSAYRTSEAFMNQDFRIIGHWSNPKGESTVRIIESELGEYYFHDLYMDGSYYPVKLKQDEKYPKLFRLDLKPDFYYGIQPNGDLTVKDVYGKRTLKPVD